MKENYMKKILFMVFLFIPFFVYANENKYVNSYDVEMDSTTYNELLGRFSVDDIDSLTLSEYEYLKENPTAEFVYSEKYFKNIYVKNKDGEIIDSFMTELTKEEYNSDEKLTPSELFQVNSSWIGDEKTIETEYKKLKLSVSRRQANGLYIDITNTWKKIPKVKSYDIIGFRISNYSAITFQKNSYSASQVYDGVVANYNYNTSGNTVQKSNGLAQIMNIVNKTSSSLKNTMSIIIFGNSTLQTGFKVYASYQHATTYDNTFDQVKNVTFSSSSSSNYVILGDVFKYKQSVGKNFDAMAGVEVQVTP